MIWKTAFKIWAATAVVGYIIQLPILLLFFDAKFLEVLPFYIFFGAFFSLPAIPLMAIGLAIGRKYFEVDEERVIFLIFYALLACFFVLFLPLNIGDNSFQWEDFIGLWSLTCGYIIAAVASTFYYSRAFSSTPSQSTPDMPENNSTDNH